MSSGVGGVVGGNGGSGSAPPRNRVRKRPVTFGNPSLGTYHGIVYTLEGPPHQHGSCDGAILSSSGTKPAVLVENGVQVDRLVAMVEVPPEQVPEGVLNLARSHRPWIDHVRIVIEAECCEDEHEPRAAATAGGGSGEEEEKEGGKIDQQEGGEGEAPSSSFSFLPSPTASAAESAASILAAEHHAASNGGSGGDNSKSKNSMPAAASSEDEKKMAENAQESQQQQRDGYGSRGGGSHHGGGGGRPSPHDRSYLVLFELRSQEAADQLVGNLHGQPYTCLDMDQKCSVHHVAALHGEDGVSLMSPFFASSTETAAAAAAATVGAVATTTAAAEAGGAAAATAAGDLLTILPSASAASSASSAESSTAVADNRNSSINTGTNQVAGVPTASACVTSSSQQQQHSSKPPTEDYNCAVCLEHMQLDRAAGGGGGGESTSILTTVCNHSFHMDCLLQWQDSPCPVCRYDHSGLNEALSQCHICGRTDNNFVCLICGVVSCGGGGGRLSASAAAAAHRHPSSPGRDDDQTSSCASAGPSCAESISFGGADVSSSAAEASRQRMSTSHARQHYDETLHAYALDTETQHCWDFAGQGYVHRLLQNKEDGKLVEVNDPFNTASQERSQTPGLSDAQEGEVVHRKLEGFASQYYTLLKSQLEQQRIYYEGRLEEIRRENELKDHHKNKRTSDLIVALKQERHQLSQRLGCLKSRCNKVRDDAAFLKNMNESLEANKSLLKKQVADAQQQRLESKRVFEECLPPLQEKVTLLMLQLESGAAAAAEAGEDAKKPAAR